MRIGDLVFTLIGSNLGGIAELVRLDSIDRWLVTANDTKTWTEALRQLATDANLLTADFKESEVHNDSSQSQV
ncbi:hypothetical protein [Nostoc sp.]